jgi:hypothetical protein
MKKRIFGWIMAGFLFVAVVALGVGKRIVINGPEDPDDPPGTITISQFLK